MGFIMYSPSNLRDLPHLRTEPFPTMYDLLSEDPEEPGLHDQFHELHPQLLRETCQLPDISSEEYIIGAGLNVYYDSRNTLWSGTNVQIGFWSWVRHPDVRSRTFAGVMSLGWNR